MPRIIAGRLGGRTLTAPRGDRTRPTSERTREAIFSRLVQWNAIADARVLDLYAGSGAFGLEALSRGARESVFVEQHPGTARIITGNIRALGLRDLAEVEVAKVIPFVERAAGPFDLVFADPPYDVATADVERIAQLLVDRHLLGPGATVVLERSARDPAPQWPAELEDLGTRTYGETAVFFGGL